MIKHDFFKHANHAGAERKERINGKVLFSRVVEENVQPGFQIIFGLPGSDQDFPPCALSVTSIVPRPRGPQSKKGAIAVWKTGQYLSSMMMPDTRRRVYNRK